MSLGKYRVFVCVLYMFIQQCVYVFIFVWHGVCLCVYVCVCACECVCGVVAFSRNNSHIKKM
jgi:hypothetical protein